MVAEAPTARSSRILPHWILPVALAALLLPGAAQAQHPAPGASWPVATAARLGLNPAVLDSLHEEITAGRYGYVDRMLVIRHGRIAIDKPYAHDYDAAYDDSAKVTNALNAHDPTGPFNYFNPWRHPTYRRERLHTLQSGTKTITSIVIGVAVTRGDFPGIDTPVLHFVDTTGSYVLAL